ncbi:MAG: S41 family peptidase [Bacteroidales bacterium]
MHVGPKVTLMDKYSASDGDLFPYRFQQLELGTTIGTRSWGGVVGYSGAQPLIDGGSLITPSFGPYAKDGSRFVIEGEGVTPDIIIENDPAKLYKGWIFSLSRAIQETMEQIKTWPEKIAPIPPFPDKSGKNSITANPGYKAKPAGTIFPAGFFYFQPIFLIRKGKLPVHHSSARWCRHRLS